MNQDAEQETGFGRDPRTITQRLKQFILPVWNLTHRLGWAVGELLMAVVRGRWGWCSVCGRWALWRYRRWVITPELERRWKLSRALGASVARKESSDCCWCGAKLRARRLAEVILDHFNAPSTEAKLHSIRQWSADATSQRLRVAEINMVDGLHRYLTRLQHLAFSDYNDSSSASGDSAGIQSEDLCNLTYADNSFDLIVTSETLEHVPDLKRALVELYRVLRPGGWHLFTIPLLPTVGKTFPRAILNEAGEIRHLTTPIAHPGGNWGYPVFTEFGLDFPGILSAAGFETTIYFGPTRTEDVCQVFGCRRPVSSAGSSEFST